MGWLSQNIILIVVLVLCVGMCIFGMSVMSKKDDNKSNTSSDKNEKDKVD